MARDFPGLPFASLPEPTAPDFTNRLRNILGTIHHWAMDQSNGMARIAAGEVPSGAGGAPGGGGVLGVTDHGLLTGLSDDDHTQYALLGGRFGGQELFGDTVSAGGFLRLLGNAGTGLDRGSVLFMTAANQALSKGVVITPQTGRISVNLSTGSAAASVDINGENGSASCLLTRAFSTTSGAMIQCLTSASWTAFTVTAAGRLIVESNTSATGVSAAFNNSVGDNAAIPIAVTAKSTQTGNLTEWRDSASTVLASVGPTGVISTTGTISADTSITSFASAATVYDGFGFLMLDSSTFHGQLAFGASGLTADRLYQFPDADGLVLLGGVAAALVGTGSSTLTSNTTSVGASFIDITTSTKRLRFPLSGAVGNNAITIVSTAAREYKTQDVAGSFVLVGNQAAAADKLGKITLTGQTASLGTQTLLTASANSVGAYRVSLYLTTTTTGDIADNVTLTLAWNDGAAQTMVVGFLGTTSNILPYTAHDLRTANAFSEATVVVRVAASTAITFTTTLTSPGAGTPAYSLDARIEALG